ncbi:SDR family NAD(P)-dependent oxidoreductase [Paenibacillus harenae]|uniref:SDR family NAD(P)-dependent oxidoreductase n=1 Tax=Paenibacillus harenae TaxID=306543 RepID=UPI0004005A81|nr:SDR family oxidoreductase [Paenibacillus harenae]
MNKAGHVNEVLLITGTRKGIGYYLAEYYASLGYKVIGCSRGPADTELPGYRHYCLDVADEAKVKQMFAEIARDYGRIDVLVNNAGIASMNHVLLTPMKTVQNILNTNVIGTFLFCREAGKLMSKRGYGRIINFATVAAPLKLEGEAVYAASKAAVASLTEVLARELAEFGITVNAVGPTPVKTDLIRSVPQAKMEALLNRQAIKRFGEFQDIANVIDFLMKPESDFVTGQVLYLGGV